MTASQLRSLRDRFLPASPESASLPAVRYFATMGELPEPYGGTANVIFHRSNAIATQTGDVLEILTFGHIRDYGRINREMHDDGRLVEGVRFRSMWTDLAIMIAPAADERGATYGSFAPLDESSTDEVIHGEGVPIRRFRKGPTGKNLQIDLLRADGSIIVSDRRDAANPERLSNRSIILCDQLSRPVREFFDIDELRRHWLDLVIGQDQAVLFSDTYGLAGFTHTYRRPNTVVIQTFHNHHLRHGESGSVGYTKDAFLPFLKNVDTFDATVFLTSRQLADVDELMGAGQRRWVVPNSRDAVSPPSDKPRDRTSGIMVGRLVVGKQTGHAIRAIIQANEQLSTPVSLDIYGEGEHRERMERLIDEVRASTVTLKGHDASASQKFASASFSLLTSRSEAMSLVLVESMAGGCIPIAYDVRYGPREIITDGVNGFLIPPGSVEGVAEAVIRVQSMGTAEITQMRQRAQARARDFSDSAVLQKWALLLSTTFRNKLPPSQLGLNHHSVKIDTKKGSFDLRIDLETNRDLVEPRAHVMLVGRIDPAIMRIECSLRRVGNRRYSARCRVPEASIDWITTSIVNLSLELQDSMGRCSTRLASPASDVSMKDFRVYSTPRGNLSLSRS